MDSKPAPQPFQHHSPDFRNLVHCGAFFAVGLPFIGVIRFVDWWYNHSPPHWVVYMDYSFAGFLACVAFFNAFVLKNMPFFNRMMRSVDGRDDGIWIYPAVLAGCFALFPAYVAMAAWAVLACGDAPASYLGRRIPRYALPWNPKKTYAGFAAFIFSAMCGAFLSLMLLPCPLFTDNAVGYAWTMAAIAAAVGAVVESLESRIDDNIRVPISAGAAILGLAYGLNLVMSGLPKTTHVQPQNIVYALLANGVLGGLVLLLRYADVPATILGMALGTLIFFIAGWQGFVIFVLFVGAGSFLTKMGIQKKTQDHTAEPNAGKRGIRNAAANLLVPALCCALYPLFGGRPSLLMAFAGAIAAALADTASSEIGVLSPAHPVLVTTRKKVPHGTNGAISLLGTAGAVAACLVIAIAAGATGFVRLAAGKLETPSRSLVLAGGTAIFLAGMTGTLVDSILGATLEGRLKFFGKSTVNFVCTLTGALFAGVCTEIWLYFTTK